MAKQPSKSDTAPQPKPQQEKHVVRLAHPEEMPPILTAMEGDGWQLITIVHCRHTNEHAAYFRRIDIPSPK